MRKFISLNELPETGFLHCEPVRGVLTTACSLVIVELTSENDERPFLTPILHRQQSVLPRHQIEYVVYFLHRLRTHKERVLTVFNIVDCIFAPGLDLGKFFELFYFPVFRYLADPIDPTILHRRGPAPARGDGCVDERLLELAVPRGLLREQVDPGRSIWAVLASR